MTGRASFSRHGDIGLVHIAAPRGAGLTPDLRRWLAEHLRQAEADSRVRAIVLLAEHGALAAEPGRAPENGAVPGARDLAARIEACRKPVIGALDGAALDEGLEVFIACRLRYATRRSRFGFPLAALGLVPAAGGTQRLPRLVGTAAALDLMATGRLIEAPTAETLGLIDAVEKEPLVGSAVSNARRLSERDMPPPVSRRPAGASPDDAARDAARLAALGIPQMVSGRLAEAVQAAATLSFEEGMAVEAELAVASRADPPAAGRLHLAAARIACREAPELHRADAWPLGSVAVVGGGRLGSALAILCAEWDLPVMLVDRNPTALSRGLGLAQDHFTLRVEEDRWDKAVVQARAAHIQYSTVLREVANASIVIEAVTEDPDVKQEVFRELGEMCRPRAVLASATAGVDVGALAAVTPCAAQVLALHVVPPALERRVVEIAAGPDTDPAAVRTAAAFAARIGRIPVAVAARPGLPGTRLLEAWMREACLLVEEGAVPAAVDAAAEEFGCMTGPFALADFLGVAGAWRWRAEPEGSVADRLPRLSLLPDRLVAKGRRGLSTGAGWHRYRRGDPTPFADDAIAAEVAGDRRRTVGDEEIRDRLVYGLINQAAHLLESDPLLSPGALDVLAVDAVTFPERRGGPLFHADTLGLAAVAEHLRRLEAAHGQHFHPAALLVRLAEKGRRFADWTPADRAPG